MVRNTNLDGQTVRAQLDSIADHWALHGHYPDDISERDVEAHIKVLYNQVEDRFKTVVTDTTFTRREAEVWVLLETSNEHNHLLTDNAVSLIISTLDREFNSSWQTNGRHKMCFPVTPEEVRSHHTAAKQKIQDAKQTLEATTPHQEDTHSNSKIDRFDK